MHDGLEDGGHSAHADNAFAQIWRARLAEGDEEYRGKNHELFAREPEYLAALMSSVPEIEDRLARSLEIGCGTAFSSLRIAWSRHAIPYALDISLEAIRLAKRTFQLEAPSPGKDVRPIVADAGALPFPDASFDFVFSTGLLEHFHDPFPILKEQARVLRPSGRLFVCVPQTFTVYTVAKQALIRLGRWSCGWETQFTARQLARLGETLGLRVWRRAGSGYDKISRALVWAALRLLGRGRLERAEKRYGHLFMKNLIVVFERPS